MTDEMAWNDTFPALNLYNYPSYGVVDVWEEARKLGVVPVPEQFRQMILFGRKNDE